MGFFENDFKDAFNSLKKEKRKGFWKKTLSFGILNNDYKIEIAEKYLNESYKDLDEFNKLKDDADSLDKINDTIEISGIRISKHIFSDLKVVEKEDYPIDWAILRDSILQRDNFVCQESDGNCHGPLQIHHIIELSKGGSNSPDNLITLCRFHHSLKHPHMQKDF